MKRYGISILAVAIISHILFEKHNRLFLERHGLCPCALTEEFPTQSKAQHRFSNEIGSGSAKRIQMLSITGFGVPEELSPHALQSVDEQTRAPTAVGKCSKHSKNKGLELLHKTFIYPWTLW